MRQSKKQKSDEEKVYENHKKNCKTNLKIKTKNWSTSSKTKKYYGTHIQPNTETFFGRKSTSLFVQVVTHTAA